MLDRYSLIALKRPLASLASLAERATLRADHVTLFGFVLGLLSMLAIVLSYFWLAGVLLLLNRLCDGVDGELARRQGATDAGAFLDIVLDFIIYSGVVFAFAVNNPSANALAASALIFSFMGTGASFLAFSIMAERRKAHSVVYPSKGIYYLAGLMEGTETIVLLVLFCLLPQHFAPLAWAAAMLCYLSAALRVWGGYWQLRDKGPAHSPP